MVFAAYGCNKLTGFLFLCVPFLCILLYTLDGIGTAVTDLGLPENRTVGTQSKGSSQQERNHLLETPRVKALTGQFEILTMSMRDLQDLQSFYTTAPVTNVVGLEEANDVIEEEIMRVGAFSITEE